MNSSVEKIKFTYNQSFSSYISMYPILIILFILFVKISFIDIGMIPVPFQALAFTLAYCIVYLCIRTLYCFVKYKRISSKYSVYSIKELSAVSGIKAKRVRADLRALIIFCLFSPTCKDDLKKFVRQPEPFEIVKEFKQLEHLVKRSYISENKERYDDEMDRLFELLDNGDITEEEFRDEKDKVYALSTDNRERFVQEATKEKLNSEINRLKGLVDIGYITEDEAQEAIDKLCNK